MKAFGVIGGALADVLDGKCYEDETDGNHEETKNNVAGVFNAGFSSGEFAGIDLLNGLVRQDEGEVGKRVEDGICHGSEERQGA